MLHKVYSPPHKAERCVIVQFAATGKPSEGLNEFLFRCREIAILVEVADDEFRGLGEGGIKSQGSQLPRQVIGQSRRLGEKVLKRGPLVLFIFRLGPVTGIKILLEIRTE